MPNRVIENPIINSPFREPSRHFVFDQDGITDQVAERRRRSAYFVPIPRARKLLAPGGAEGDEQPRRSRRCGLGAAHRGPTAGGVGAGAPLGQSHGAHE